MTLLPACGTAETPLEARDGIDAAAHFPDDRFRLEEINMPEEHAAALAGKAVAVEVLREE